MDFSLAQVYKEAFGYDPSNVPASLPKKQASNLGQEYYKEDLSGREFFLPVTLNDYVLPFAVMGMTWKKTFVSTSMPERGGSVKELISIDDYEFNVKGILLNDDNSFPEQQIIDIHNIFLINASIIIRSVLSDIVLKGNAEQKVIVKDIKWPAVVGVEHAKPFELVLESDMILDLELI